MARRAIPQHEGLDAVDRALAPDASRTDTALAVRYLLQCLAERAPGKSVEVRVPPFGAVQCVEGPGHTRGTPPNVIEMPAALWLDLATGRTDWAAATATGKVSSSGTRARLDGLVPLLRR